MGPITKWHEVVSTKNYQLLEEILDDNVIFYSPVVFTPQKGKEITKIYLSAAAEVFEGNSFSYVRELIKDNEAALEFKLELDEIKVNGVDLITWNHEKKNNRVQSIYKTFAGRECFASENGSHA